MNGLNYILAFLQLEQAVIRDQLAAMESLNAEDRDYTWRQMNDRLVWKQKYVARLVDELQGRMPEVERWVAKLQTHGSK